MKKSMGVDSVDSSLYDEVFNAELDTYNLFVSMPNRSYKDSNGNTQYSDIAHAVTKEVREAINKQVLDAYNQALEENQSDDFTEMDDEDLSFDEDGSMGFAPSM